MTGFFSPSMTDRVKPRMPRVAKCGACGLHALCNRPQIPVYGEGRKGILIIGSAPTMHENAYRTPFQRGFNTLVRDGMQEFGVNVDRDCWYTSAINCKPDEDRDPTPKEIEYCRPNLIKILEKHKPKIVIPMGSAAMRAILPYVWKNDGGGITKWAGWQIPSQKLNAWICPTIHPLHVTYSKESNATTYFMYHIGHAVAKESRPWKVIPDYTEGIETIMSPDRAAERIAEMHTNAKMIAWDYETNCLKPEMEGSRIVSCSICDGKETIAYPWHGAAITATIDILKSDIPKIASNLKFENRWTKNKLGFFPRNWKFDTMIGAHALDNRVGTKSIKFQSFVRLGAPEWNSHIEPYLKSKKGSELNNIDEINLNDLLVYNALDSILEYKVAIQQMNILGIKYVK